MIRIAATSDSAALLDLIEEFNRVDNHPHDQHRIERALGPLLESEDFGVVYVWGTPISGYAVVTWGYSLESGGRDALLDEFYVRDRRRGEGSKALVQVLANLGQRGLSRIFLETERANVHVRRFYRRVGFVEEDSIWMARRL